MRLLFTLLLLFISSLAPLSAQDCFSQSKAEELLALLEEYPQFLWLEEAGFVEVFLDDEINYQIDASCGYIFYLQGTTINGKPFRAKLSAKKMYFAQNGEVLSLSKLLSQKETSGNYLICNSKSAYTYHKGYCRGLNRCTHGISRVSEARARALGRRRCKFCW
ncbi:hypothetical protein PPO43_05565 [Saprospira sp. CCB-QB6]|uniref:hypothetical protein n=1 Tax=Saprospira sp. CCB-QB6 TaxID=3023936 RepID=UPI00234A9511|nr:hypothetical protein [Saprospira sp. CCB-QB6]WCL82565.1 hypothetical protein PPO43_05565 [Saprospira sp. CCB-QB6]